MSDDDMIRRGDALAAIQLGDTVTKLQARIRAIPCVDADPVCTGCGGTGVTYQTERRCACQGPDLTDPVTVHVNMLRGTIAKPTVEQIIHLYGREAFQPMIDVAIAKALEKACLAVSEHADWPEDEHGRTEQVGLFARVINAIRAITPALSPAPTEAAHVNETPKSEHDGADVLTAAQAREAAARLLLDMLYMQNGAHEGVSKEDAQAMWDAANTRKGYAAVDAFLRSIIGEART